MSADRPEDRARDATSEMARDGREMEQHLDELSEHIDEAKAAAAGRQDAPEEQAAGDWEGASSGSQQGEDPADTAGEQPGAGASGEAEPAG
jgi:hypothetical protein